MSILTYPLGFLGGGDDEFYNGVIENSLKSGDSTETAYLDRDKPSSAAFGNKSYNVTTWTLSWWMKVADVWHPSGGWLFGTMPGTNHTDFLLNTSGQLYYEGNNAGLSPASPNVSGYSSMKFNDPSAWYHCVFIWDSNNGAVEDRKRLYVNGRRDTLHSGTTGTDAQGAKFYAFAAKGSGTDSAKFRIGGYYYTGSQQTYHFHGHLTDIYGIDGYALGPENFGEYKNDVWIPKQYTGPPTLITDSSPAPTGLDMFGENSGQLTYDRYYIGESAINAKTTGPMIDIQDRSKFSISSTQDFTIDCWAYDLENATTANYRFMQGGENTADGISILYGGASSPTNLQFGLTDHSGGTAKIQIARTLVGYDTKWHHISITRSNGTLKMYADGLLANSVSDTTAYYQDPTNDRLRLFGYPGDTNTGSRTNGVVDEFRWIVGESQPPRFYFGTNYGDQDGGVLPQRATSDHRFTDDERTILLVGGQSANTVVRSVSLVDESGLHTDNVHSSNSTIDAYPTQDGVGQQFTISGPQHTTKESFIGNTSSMVFDGMQDYFTAGTAASSDFEMGTGAMQYDLWFTTTDVAHVGVWNNLTLGYGDGGAPNSSFKLYLGQPLYAYVWVSGTNTSVAAPAGTVTNDGNWHHITFLRDRGDDKIKVYLDGYLLNETAFSGTSSINPDSLSSARFNIAGAAAPAPAQAENFEGYLDEIRVMKGSIDRPRIKWTHTQTAGAGNKAPYDVYGWKANGHEFTDDNATELLIHGDTNPRKSGWPAHNGTGMELAETAFFGYNTGNSPNNQATVYFAGDAAASRDTLMVAMWFQTGETALSYMSRFGWSVGNIAVVNENTMKLQFGATTSWDVPCSDGNWHLVCAEYGNTADDIIVYFDGYKVYSEMNSGDVATYVKSDDAVLYIGSYNGTDYEFTGVVGQWGAWTHDAASDSNYMVENGVPKALFDAGPGANWKSATGDYSSTYAGYIRHYYAFGNQDSLGTGNDGTGTAHADTTSTVYDRAAAGSSYAALNLTGDGTINKYVSAEAFVDSSIANSLVHAVVSGGGAHHSKAVTLKSDGTNGTSRTDSNGNTIYWCGSNSTVTFANSSSFDYGNTAIRVAGSSQTKGYGLSTPDSADWDFTSSDATICGWIYVDAGYMGSGQYPPLVGQSITSDGNWKFHLTLNEQVAFGKEGVSQTVSGTGVVNECTWHHMHLTWDDSAGVVNLFIDGYQVHTASSDQFNAASTVLGIGWGFYNFHGYIDEIMIWKGEVLPPRFYLGNQAPITGSTLTAVKSILFTRADGDEYSRSGTAINTIRDTADFGTVFWWCKQKTMDGDAVIADMGDSPTSTNLRMGYGPDGWRVQGWFTQDTVDRSNFQYPSGGTAGQSDINDDGEWVFGAFTVPKNNARSSGGGSLISFQGIGDKLFVSDDTYTTSTGSADHKFFGSQVGGTAVNLSIGGGYHYSGHGSWCFNGHIAQVGITGGTVSGMGSPGVLTHEQLKAIWELGPAGDARTITAVGDGSGTSPLQWYFNANLESGTRVTDGTAMYDLVTTDGTTDLTTVRGTPVANTSYIYASGAKRLSASQINEQSFLVANTSYFGNTHYADTKPQSVTCENFGGFVDDEYTVLLLRGGHADGNTAFYDGGKDAGETITFPAHSHSYGKTRVAKSITPKSAGPTHESTAELGLHGTSIDLPGDSASSYNKTLDCGHHLDYNFGDTFVHEAWIYSDDAVTTGTHGIFTIQGSASNNTYNLGTNSSGKIAIWLSSTVAASQDILANGAAQTVIAATTWYHVAFQCKPAGPGKYLFHIFINGVCEYENLASGYIYSADPAPNFRLGCTADGGNNYWNGKLDEIRLTKGIARYTLDGVSQSGIVPSTATGAGAEGTSIPTSPYLRPTPYVAADGGRGFWSANSNVKLWIKSDARPGESTFTDHCAEIGNVGKPIMNEGKSGAGAPRIRTDEYALSGGSDAIYFDGADDVLVVPQHKDLKVMGNFTAECWFRQIHSAGTDQTLWAFANDIGSLTGAGSDNEYHKVFTYQSDHIRVSNWKSGHLAGTLIGASITVGAWHHVALQRENRKYRLFLDGVEDDGNPAFGTGYEEDDFTAIWGSDLYIGGGKDGTGFVGGHYYEGYIDEFRWSRMARYTGQGLIDSNYPNPGTEFGIQTEGSTYGLVDEQVTANTTYQRYNYQHSLFDSYEYDGTNDYIQGPENLMTTETTWTWSTWLNWGASGTGWYQVATNDHAADGTSSPQDNRVDFSIKDKKLQVNLGNSGGGTDLKLDSSYTLTSGDWILWTVVRTGSGGNYLQYVNGNLISTHTNATGYNFTTGKNTAWIGSGPSGAEKFDGRISMMGYWDVALSGTAIGDLYSKGPKGDWTTNGPNGNYTNVTTGELRAYYAMGNQDALATGSYTRSASGGNSTGGSADSGTALYDRSGNGKNAATLTSMPAPDSDTKLLIHSNKDLDGDTNIVDSSPSAHLIDRVVTDPIYATRPAALTGLPNQTANTCIYGRDIAEDYLALPDDQSFRIGTGQFTIVGWQYTATEQGAYQDLFNKGGGFQFGRQTGTDKMAWFGGTADETTSSTTAEDAWHHVAVTRNTSQVDVYVNGSDDATESGTGWNADLDYAAVPIKINSGTSSTAEVYVDQVAFYTGVALSSTHIGHIRGGGNGNTKFGTLGGMILHEEYGDGTNTANAATAILLHSNNATHHTYGSRLFYNDVANTRFTTTTGHEAAGRFTIGAASGYFTVLGAHQTGYSPAMQNPSIRLKRGYTYIFSASSLSTHKFYFANNTSDYAASTTLANQYIGGQYGTNSTVDGTETWTAFSAGHFLGGGGTSGEWNHMKFEVPTNAPKDLYYRCAASGHGAMGNAVFVMEATEPAPVKVGDLPALKTSTWNDRDYAGIGTNKSVMHFDGASYLTIPDHINFHLVDSNTEWSIEAWVFPSKAMTGDGIIMMAGSDANNRWQFYWSSGKQFKWYIRINSVDRVDINTNSILGDLPTGQWYHVVMTRSTGGVYSIYVNGRLGVASSAWTGEWDYWADDDLHIGRVSYSASDYWNGFMDEIVVHKIEATAAAGSGAYSANNVIERYMAGRKGDHYTANNSTVLHIKSDTTYGSTTITDSSPSAHTITNVGGVYHHLDDNRTANTALYFDGYSMLRFPNTTEMKLGADGADYCIEAWIKPKQGNGFIFYSAGGTSYNAATNNEGIRISIGSNGNANDGTGTNYDWQIHSNEQVNNSDSHVYSGETLLKHAWNHVCVQRIAHLHSGYVQILINGVLVKIGSASGRDMDGQSDMSIGGRLGNLTPTHSFVGWMDGIRITNGMPRYTSGIPTDGQSPSIKYDDGRTANTNSSDWASSSTRRYYGINTHTYLQTTKYSTNANTVLMIRGDDAETANNGVNMYGDNGFHLEFKEVGAGEERDYNNFNTGVAGLGSDTSATQEFSDDATLLLIRSRPNQANGSYQFLNEVDQSRGNRLGSEAHHSKAGNIFSVDSNTANVSIASGGTRNY